MPSPLPGMNPYLEQPGLWSEFHSRMIVALADSLDDLLSRDYRVAVEKRVYLTAGDDSILVGIPDVSVTSSEPPTRTVTATVLAEPITVEIPLAEEVQERYLEIREGATGKVITTIELLSPKNKRAGEGRNAYLNKRQQILSSATHLIEIDLLRAGVPLPAIGLVKTDYRILISRSRERPQAQLYAFSLQDPIPAFIVPLRPGVDEPVMDMQPLLHKIYDRARFELAVDYGDPLKPEISAEDERWLRSQLTDQP